MSDVFERIKAYAGHRREDRGIRNPGVTAREAIELADRIAAMRCYVASKLGDEVDIPNELL